MTTPMRVTVGDWVALRAQTHAETRALECSGAALTYAALDQRVEAIAALLRNLGVADGEPVALLMGNGIAFACFTHGVPRAGALLIPLNTRLSTAELAWQLSDARARLLIADTEHLDRAREAAATAGVEVIDVGDPRWQRDGGPGDASVEEAPDRPHSVIYTSGTTGLPKGAVLTHGNLYWSAVASAENLGVETGDRWLACLPLFHVGGLSILLRSAIYGTTAVIHERFDEARAGRALREEGITVLSVVSTMLQRMFDADEEPYSDSVRGVLLGGGPAPRSLLEEAQRRGLPVLQTYGLTEAASQVATLSQADALRKVGSAGLPLLSSTVRIEVDGAPAEPGEVGEILVSGPTVCAGYLRRPDATDEAIRDGWLYTGDLGYLDEEGYLYIADRRDDLIVSGGENVYPAEVEAALISHPAIEDCAVIGLPDERWGALVTAVVLPKDAPPTVEELEAHLRASLAGYKLPRRFEYTRDPLPRTASGKLQRHIVRERLLPPP